MFLLTGKKTKVISLEVPVGLVIFGPNCKLTLIAMPGHQTQQKQKNMQYIIKKASNNIRL